MSMKVMGGGSAAALTPLGQRLIHRKRLLRLYVMKNDETRGRLLAGRTSLGRLGGGTAAARGTEPDDGFARP